MVGRWWGLSESPSSRPSFHAAVDGQTHYHTKQNMYSYLFKDCARFCLSLLVFARAVLPPPNATGGAKVYVVVEV